MVRGNSNFFLLPYHIKKSVRMLRKQKQVKLINNKSLSFKFKLQSIPSNILSLIIKYHSEPSLIIFVNKQNSDQVTTVVVGFILNEFE